MTHFDSKQHRLLTIAPSSRGFGFAVLEGENTLVNWGSKSVNTGDKNAQSLVKIAEMMDFYQPHSLFMKDTFSRDSRRSPRIRTLTRQIMALAGTRKLKVRLFSESQVKRAFFEDGKGTKHDLAKIIAERFPDQLGFRLPPKRQAWKSEDSRMDMFDAVALALVSGRRRTR